jgi:DNA-binding MarR family transcriptional regulator
MQSQSKPKHRASASGTNSSVPLPSLPLPSLLSQVLVAFTIEFDNEFERQMPHRTTTSKPGAGSRNGPWLVSLVMWSNLMRCVSENGITVAELQRLTRIEMLSLAGMERWGYIVVERGPSTNPAKSSWRVSGPPRPDWVVRPTANGRRAQEVWRPLFEVIEERWQARFGADEISEQRESLLAVVRQFDFALPDYLPVLGYGLSAEILRDDGKMPPSQQRGIAPHPDLPALLSKVLLAFTIEFERESDLSLAICANAIRLLGEAGIPIRDLPLLSGVSKEAIKVAIGFLEKRRFVTVGPDPTSARTKVARLTPKGQAAQDAYRHRLAVTEERWAARFGNNDIGKLRESLEPLVGKPNAPFSPLFRGLEPDPEGWRASNPKPITLPHHPMVLHRGGYPDGS